MDTNFWQRWLHMHRIAIILEHDLWGTHLFIFIFKSFGFIKVHVAIIMIVVVIIHNGGVYVSHTVCEGISGVGNRVTKSTAGYITQISGNSICWYIVNGVKIYDIKKELYDRPDVTGRASDLKEFGWMNRVAREMRGQSIKSLMFNNKGRWPIEKDGVGSYISSCSQLKEDRKFE